ncbi:MAG: hypothetical protein HDR51_00330 [Treponema sp.]|nr:hypothetical protein [Treponema sp.]
MQRKQIILARAGTFGSEGNPQMVTEDDLREIADSYKPGDVIPVTIVLDGHPEGKNFPKLGEVVNLFFDEESNVLKGELKLNDALAAAMNDGYYDNWSIGAKRRAGDGKMYLHHLALLGETPPAIKDLREKVMTSLSLADFDNDIIFSFADSCINSVASLLRRNERKRLCDAVMYKITIPLRERLLQLADTLYAGEITLADSDGVKRQTTIYSELADIFEDVKKKVEPGILDLDGLGKIRKSYADNHKNILKKG